ncbi:MAG: ABC transporter substrate-binding protein [Deltaproteobacteria bacterium]|nr:ABC transporter substrate-binding protein [Deltaproteobacteria bacterium]
MTNVSRTMAILIAVTIGYCGAGSAQERIKLDYSSVDASNAVWYTAQEVGLFKKHGLDSELIYIPSTTTAVSAIIAGEIPLGNASGGGVASAVVGGANLVMVACMLNTLPYELVVHESIKTVEDLRGKNIGISRIGSASDVAARVLVKALGLEPVKDVPILQVGGAPERAGAFRSGRIAGFPSPPGIIKLAEGMPHRVLISTADFQKRFDFPFICATTTKSFLSSRRETAKRVLMALIESTHFFKTRKEESKKIIAKYNPRGRGRKCRSKRRWPANRARRCGSRTSSTTASCGNWKRADSSTRYTGSSEKQRSDVGNQKDRRQRSEISRGS